MNETLSIIAERFSCRSFTGQMPSDNMLSAVAQAAIQAPSGMNRQLWQVIVVKNRDLINEMQTEGTEILAGMQDRSMYERIMSRGGKLFYNAPCMAVIAVKESDPKGAELIDCGILAQTIVLAASSLGLSTLHCGLVGLAFAGSKAEDFKKRLKFPEGYQCGMGILLGYPTEKSSPHMPDQSKITIIN